VIRFERRQLQPTILALVALVPAASAAQTPPAFSVSVTEPYELVEEIGTTRRLTRADIEARNARTLDEALRLLPGIYVRTGGDGTPRIDVRGFRSRHVLLLIDGVLVNSMADGQFDPARISTDAIREIKVSYGTSSVLYGDNAMAGVIEVTTLDDKPDATVDISAAIPDQKRIGGHYARTMGKWSLTAAATGYGTNGFELPDDFVSTTLEDGDRRQNSDRDRGDVRASLGYRPSASLSIASEWSFGTGSYGIPPGTVDDTSDIFAQSPRFERVEDYRAASGQVSVVAAPWRRFNLRAWAYRNAQREDRARYDDATYSSMDDPLVQGTFESRERTTVTGSSALARLDIGRLGAVRLAVNQRRESFDSSGVIRDVARSGGGGGGGGGGGRGGGSGPAAFDVRAFEIDSHVDVYSTGAEWELRPASRIGAVLGAAANRQRRPGGVTETEPTWLAGLFYDAADALRLHASIARKIRVPSIDQLFNASSGNPLLRPERANAVEVGANYRLDVSTTVALSGFSTHARDFIERVSGSPFENQDRYRFRGTELTVQTTRIPSLSLRGGYSYLHSVAREGEETQPLQTRPRHRGSLEWQWTPLADSTVRGAVYQTGSQFYDSRGAVPVQMRADKYTLVDLGFTQRSTRNLSIALDVSNLFDRLYDQSYGLPREGRAAMLTLRASAR
jgi:outer membrane receptor protein involved in Fe transport